MQKAFQQLIQTHKGILYKIGRSYTQTSADFEDLYQEMLIQLWQAYPRFKGKSKVSTWLYRVALNTAITYLRKRERQPQTSGVEGLNTLSDNPFEQAEIANEQQRQLDALYQAINQLKKEERAIILLHLEGKQYDEIADIIGITTNNVGVKLLRAKEKLRKKMKA